MDFDHVEIDFKKLISWVVKTILHVPQLGLLCIGKMIARCHINQKQTFPKIMSL